MIKNELKTPVPNHPIPNPTPLTRRPHPRPDQTNLQTSRRRFNFVALLFKRLLAPMPLAAPRAFNCSWVYSDARTDVKGVYLEATKRDGKKLAPRFSPFEPLLRPLPSPVLPHAGYRVASQARPVFITPFNSDRPL